MQQLVRQLFFFFLHDTYFYIYCLIRLLENYRYHTTFIKAFLLLEHIPYTGVTAQVPSPCSFQGPCVGNAPSEIIQTYCGATWSGCTHRKLSQFFYLTLSSIIMKANTKESIAVYLKQYSLTLIVSIHLHFCCSCFCAMSQFTSSYWKYVPFYN